MNEGNVNTSERWREKKVQCQEEYEVLYSEIPEHGLH